MTQEQTSQEEPFMHTPDIAIAIITHNSEKSLALTIESIIRSVRHPYKLVLIESESTDRTAQICDEYAEEYPHIEVHHTKKEGPMRAINYALKVTAPYDVYLTHDDVIYHSIFPTDWLEIISQISKQKDCGAVTTIAGGGVSGPEYLDGFKWVGTWSVYLPRRIIEKIGYLDLEFEPGNGDDIDYTYRIVKAGYRIYVVNYHPYHHRITEHSNDNSMDMEKIKKRNAEYFRKKHKLAEFADEKTSDTN